MTDRLNHLEPCPFKHDKLDSIYIDLTMENYPMPQKYVARCPVCQGQGPEADTHEQAGLLWNARARKVPNEA